MKKKFIGCFSIAVAVLVIGWNTANNKIGLVTQKLQYDKKSDSFIDHSTYVR